MSANNLQYTYKKSAAKNLQNLEVIDNESRRITCQFNAPSRHSPRSSTVVLLSILATVDLILLLTCQAGIYLRPLFLYKGSEKLAKEFLKVHLTYSSFLMILSNVLQLSNIWNTGTIWIMEPILFKKTIMISILKRWWSEIWKNKAVKFCPYFSLEAP